MCFPTVMLTEVRSLGTKTHLVSISSRAYADELTTETGRSRLGTLLGAHT